MVPDPSRRSRKAARPMTRIEVMRPAKATGEAASCSSPLPSDASKSAVAWAAEAVRWKRGG